MKRVLILLISIIAAAGAFSEQAPYISFDISEGMVTTDTSDIITSYNIFADIGYIIKTPDGSSYMVMYELLYQGPGLRPLSSESLMERNQDHFFVFKYMKEINPKLSFKAKANYLLEYYRLSKSE
ncbi:MAG: hypothetical protein PHV06_06000, partial [bacterium]|nr:hypothetical protein [bacterium]